MDREKKVKEAISQAAGNVQLEEMDISLNDMDKVRDVLNRYYEKHSDEAVHSLFYDLVQAIECQKKENEDKNGKKK